MLNYNKLNEKKEKNWLVEETKFDVKYLGKTEAIMNIGNGYLGIRSANEESYNKTVRNTFIAGTFNKFDETEVTELPNTPDVMGIEIIIDGDIFSLLQGSIENYSKVLNCKNGEVTRTCDWISPNNKKINFKFGRFASLKNLHVIAQYMEIKSEDDIKVEIVSGINGQVSNSGAQHFSEGEKRCYEGKYMQQCQTTTQSRIDFVINTINMFNIDIDCVVLMDRRVIKGKYNKDLSKGQTLRLEKISNFNTNRDKENENKDLNQLKSHSLEELKVESKKGYIALLEESSNEWNKYWEKSNIVINGDDYAQLTYHFAMFHMRVFTPMHDNRMNIGAKGFSGEGYKGHTFWDTELFMLPIYIYTDPKVARSLLEYRYFGLEGARRKAKDNGFKGAQYPWESAWITDGEVTPIWGAADIVTGESTKIMSGFIEQHITADVIYSVWLYYNVTKDEDFMEKYGYEIILDTANFWSTRAEKDGDRYVMNNVIGPDEYKEHVDNNAFTNYMAKWNIDLAIEYLSMLRSDKPELLSDICKRIELCEEEWKCVSEKLYIPVPNENNIIPQDDTYLTLKEIDLTKYKNQEHVGSLFFDYNLKQVGQIQVSKQADIMVLFWLMESMFSKEIKVDNFHYYEPKTLHDSSLSLSTHVILASDLGEKNLAMDLFKKACNIDLGQNMSTSDHGIHAASLGGIWEGIVYGFAGVRFVGSELRIQPNLPKKWNDINLSIVFEGQRLNISVNHEGLIVENTGFKKISFKCNEENNIVLPGQKVGVSC